MIPKPTGRYLLVEPYSLKEIEKKSEAFGGFSIPSEFYSTRHELERYELFRVVEAGPGVEAVYLTGDVVLVETSMLEKVPMFEDLLFVAENYIPIRFASD